MLVYRRSLVRIELFSYVKKITLFQEIWDQLGFWDTAHLPFR